MRTVIGLFDNFTQAEKAVQDVHTAGIPRNDISLLANNAASLTGAGIGAVAGGLIGALTHVGVPDEDAARYNEGVRRGGTLVTVKCAEEQANRMAQILSADGAVNIDERSALWRQEGFVPSPVTPTNTAPSATTTTTSAPPPTPAARLNARDEAVLPVVEEELVVGKRVVDHGGVRVYTHVTEQPVQKQVTLHEEHVHVERRPVDRPVTEADMAAFKEGVIEMREMAEEPVIQKQARVVEEVVIDKEAIDRTETVRDTVRHTEVEVQPFAESEHVSRTAADFATYVQDFRSDWQRNYASQGGTYEQYESAYRYGYELAGNPQYRGQTWTTMEPNIRRAWETRYPNTWNRMQNSIHYGWNKATPDHRGIMEKIADTVTGDRIDDKTGKPV